MSFLSEVAASWAAWAWPRALEFALFATALLLADRLLLRRVWPKLRLALHAVLLLELALPRLPWGMDLSELLLPGLAGLTAAAPLGTVVSSPAGSTAPSAGSLWVPAAFFAWAAVALTLGLGTLLRQRRAAASVLAAGRAAPRAVLDRVDSIARSLRLRRRPRVVVLDGVASPAVLGAWRPILILPSALMTPPAPGSSADGLDHALLHELLHLKRGDLWMAAALHLVATAWWFHPLAWFVAARARALRELSCDDDVVGLLRERAGAYRASLLERARAFVEAPRVGGSLGFFASPSALLARLEWLSRPRNVRPRLERGVTWLAAGALALAALPGTPLDRGTRPAELPTSIAPYAQERAAALAVVKAATEGTRPPGCLPLRHAVLTCLATNPPPSPNSSEESP